MSLTEPEAAAPAAEPDVAHDLDADARAASTSYEVGRNRPPRHAQWKKGTSGNPRGRPRMSAQDGVARVSSIPPSMRRALRRQVETAYLGAFKQVSLAEMLVNELTHQVSSRGNVAAARELLHWIAAAERERTQAEVNRPWREMAADAVQRLMGGG
jgi:hypothetical protein